MEDMKTFIQSLKSQGEQLLIRIPLKKDFKEQEMVIKKQYAHPIARGGKHLISAGLGEIASSVFGTGKGIAKKWASQSIKQAQENQISQEKQRLWGNYNRRVSESEAGYKAWFSSAEGAIKSINSTQCLKKLRATKQKTKLETKIKSAISALDFALDYLEEPEHIKKVALIKSGEPLKGRDMLREFLKGAKKYVKIQEPYPDTELLRLLEGISPSVKVQLLLGPLNKKEGTFKRELDLLRKTGMQIDVVSINSGPSSPFHDRFMIHETSAISIGTSIQGIGLRDSTINELTEWDEIEKRFDEYFDGNILKHRKNTCSSYKI